MKRPAQKTAQKPRAAQQNKDETRTKVLDALERNTAALDRNTDALNGVDAALDEHSAKLTRVLPADETERQNGEQAGETDDHDEQHR